MSNRENAPMPDLVETNDEGGLRAPPGLTGWRKAWWWFDFIILVMLGMGIVFQMPAITYVLARIGLVTARYLVRIWKTALIVILIVAAVISPTNDIPNMMLFAAPMIVLYIVSIFVAWIFNRPRTAT